jgi:2-oxoglutarate dehydrogenase E2 component (dihydrolipoamide succinyltransferase)
MPDVGLDTPVTVSQWLVRTNKPVFVGERLVELLADGVTIDLPSPATGRLVEIVAGEDDAARPGDVLGWIETDDE